MKLSIAAAVLSGSILSHPASALEIRRISDRVPEDTFARRVMVVPKEPDCFVYEGDPQYHYNGTQLGTDGFGEGVKHIWKTCGVFAGAKTHTLLSALNTGDVDDDFPRVSDDGKRVVYFTKDIKDVSTIAVVNVETMSINYVGNQLSDDYENRKSTYPDISPDGTVFTFQSSAQLAPGSTNGDRYYQNYITYDGGISFRNLAGLGHQDVKMSSTYPQVSEGGEFASFMGKIPFNGVTPTINELYLYSKKEDDFVQLTDHQAVKCDFEKIYDKMIELWGQDVLDAEGVSKASNSQCNLAPALGWVIDGKNAVGTNMLGVGHSPVRIDNTGRFLVYMSGFAHANTGDPLRTVTAANLFLRDNALGLVWQLTDEGQFGDMTEKVEEFCCPTASESKKRGNCSKKNEIMGMCCWQRPCWFPAQWPDISGDGSSLAYFNSHPLDDPNATPKDYEIMHYHVKSGTKTVVTNTQNEDFDDGYASISYDGKVVAWDSDYDFETEEDITKNNQVFAAKLTYGCPWYTAASNYMENPDVEEMCLFENDKTLTFTGYGIRVIFDNFDMATLMENVPFKRGQSKTQKKKFCTTFADTLQGDLAFVLALPKFFIEVDSEYLTTCIRRGKLDFKFMFYQSTEGQFAEIKELKGKPEKWHKVDAARLEENNYLLKESSLFKRIEYDMGM